MKRTIIQTALCTLGLVAMGSVSAGSYTTNSPTGQPGATVTYIVSFAGDGETEDTQLDASFVAGDFSAVVANAPLVAGSTCTTPGGNSIRIVPPSGGGVPLTSTSTAYCSFQVTINAAVVAPAALNFTQTFIECADSVAPPPATCTSVLSPVNAANISPQYTSAPTAPGGTITIVDPIGGGATTATLTVTNTGDVGTTLNVGAAGGLSGVLSIAPATAQAIAQGAAGTTYTISCAATVDAVDSQTLTFTHDGSNIASPASYTVNCDGDPIPAPEINATFNAVAVTDGGAVVIAAPQNTSVQQVLSFGNSGTAALSIGAVSGLSGVLSAGAPSSASVAAGVTAGGAGASNITVTCNPGTTASTVQTISVVNGDSDENPFDVSIDCQAVLAAVPAVNPAAISIVGAPSVIASGSTTLSNSGGLQLDVASCTAPLGFTLDAPAPPFSVAANGGTTTITVSCTTPAAGAAPITGDLVCQSNAIANGGVITIPLSCSGTPLVVPVMSNLGKILLASLVIGLGLLGMGLRRQG